MHETVSTHDAWRLAHVRDSWRQTAYLITAVALAITKPLLIVVGHMSDRIGRQMLAFAGCGLAMLTYVPLCMGMKHFGNPEGLRATDPAVVKGPLVFLVALPTAYVCIGAEHHA